MEEKVKLIVALIQPHKLPDVKKALYDAEIYKMTVVNAVGSGQQKGYSNNYLGKIDEVNLLKKLRVEIAVKDESVEPTIKAIIKGAQTGRIGDGKIFVLDLPKCIRIRTGECGEIAIG
jgi:nitrogen regulatory protein P-II 2